MFTHIFRKNAELGVADADDETAILDAVVERTQASAAVAAVEEQPELKPEPAPVPVDASDMHTQAELKEVRDMALAFQTRLKQLAQKWSRIGLKTESGKWALYAVPTYGSTSPYALPVVVPNDLHVGLRTFLEDCCRERKPEQKWVPPPPKPTPSEQAVAARRRFIEMKLGIPYEQVAALSEQEMADRLSREEYPITRMSTERLG